MKRPRQETLWDDSDDPDWDPPPAARMNKSSKGGEDSEDAGTGEGSGGRRADSDFVKAFFDKGDRSTIGLSLHLGTSSTYLGSRTVDRTIIRPSPQSYSSIAGGKSGKERAAEALDRKLIEVLGPDRARKVGLNLDLGVYESEAVRALLAGIDEALAFSEFHGRGKWKLPKPQADPPTPTPIATPPQPRPPTPPQPPGGDDPQLQDAVVMDLPPFGYALGPPAILPLTDLGDPDKCIKWLSSLCAWLSVQPDTPSANLRSELIVMMAGVFKMQAQTAEGGAGAVGANHFKNVQQFIQNVGLGCEAVRGAATMDRFEHCKRALLEFARSALEKTQ